MPVLTEHRTTALRVWGEGRVADVWGLAQHAQRVQETQLLAEVAAAAEWTATAVMRVLPEGLVVFLLFGLSNRR